MPSVAKCIFMCTCVQIRLHQGSDAEIQGVPLPKSPFPCLRLRSAKLNVLSVSQIHGKKILRMLQDVFCWLPLATLVDEKVLVLHGGVSDRTDLDLLAKLNRHKVLIHEPIEVPSLSVTLLRENKCRLAW